jgi:hypothetical protein
MGSLAIAILLVATSPAAPEPDPLFETSPACAVEADALFAEADLLLAPAAPPASPEPRSQSLSQAAESRIRDEDPSRSIAIQVERLTAPATAPSHRLASPGRAWPFALAATADAATTYWALGRGGAERNPLLAMGRLDVGMVKMAQFPLLAKAVDLVEGKNPRLGRRLRWTTLIFHAVLAANNVRLGRFAAQRERMTRASGTP